MWPGIFSVFGTSFLQVERRCGNGGVVNCDWGSVVMIQCTEMSCKGLLVTL